MLAIWEIFVANILPIFVAAGAGFALGRKLNPDVKTASRLVFYVFSPSLVFCSLVRVSIPGMELRQLVLFNLSASGVMVVLALAAGRALRLDRRLLVTLVVVSVFVNSGNFGLAATRFAFGETALARALVCYVFSTFAVYTAGIVIAGLGRLTLTQALRQLLGVPAFYALAAATLVRTTELRPPLFLDRGLTLLSEATIPLMLVVLGLQISTVRAWPRARLALIGLASFLQLVIAPLAALLLAHWLGLSGPTRQAAVLQASMPTAVVTTVLAVEYELDAPLVTGVVIVTTLLSPLTLTPLIAYLSA